MRFWCFKNFQMPPPKKYDNKILHVGLDDVFDTMYQGPRRHFEIGGAKIFFGVLVLIKKLEFLGRNWYLFSKSKKVGGAIAPPAPPPTRALLDYNLLIVK